MQMDQTKKFRHILGKGLSCMAAISKLSLNPSFKFTLGGDKAGHLQYLFQSMSKDK